MTQHLIERIRNWMEATAAALARAERRIMENFRAPPGGG
jgi:hypothetical protein